MAEQPTNQENNTEESKERKPGIRTMKTDVQELFRNTKPGLLDLVGQETNASFKTEQKERKKTKFLTFILVIIALTAIGGLAYVFLAPAAAPTAVGKLSPPPPFFATESSRTLSIRPQDPDRFFSLMQDAYEEPERLGIIKRIIIKLEDGPKERYATMADLVEFYRMTPPRAFLDRVGAPIMAFVYTSEQGRRFGLAMETTDLDRTFLDLLSWESSLLADFLPLFFDQKPETAFTPFEDRTFRNIDWRYQKLSKARDLGIGYVLFPAKNLLVITTSKESMETVISRLFSAN